MLHTTSSNTKLMKEFTYLSNNPYKFTVKGTTFDFYDLSDEIQFEQAAVEHAVKKLVALGKRSGNKSYGQDLHEAIMSLMRAQEQYNEPLRRTAGAGLPPAAPAGINPTHAHKGPTHPRTRTFAPPSPAPSSRVTNDPNDIEQAVQFIRGLGYSNQDNGPL